jgi:hypothetical protein
MLPVVHSNSHTGASNSRWDSGKPRPAVPRMDAPDMPSIFSRSLTGRSPIFSGSVLTKYTYVHEAAIKANTNNDDGLVMMKKANTSALPRK